MINSFFGAIFGWLLRRFFPGQAQPSAEERAGRAEAQLESERTANEIESKAGAARAAAERGVRGDGGTGAVVNSDPDAAINRNEHGHWRD